MINFEVINRIFHIRLGNAFGTAFAIDRNGKQYVITARHVVEGISTGDELQIFHEKRWKRTRVDVVGIGEKAVDVAVLACPIQLAPPYPLEASCDGLKYGQSIYFLGFPFGWGGGAEEINRGFPIPFVKAGIVSAMTSGDALRIFIDGHNNKGFSGGPVVFVPTGRPQNEFRVAGVVANYPISREPVVDRHGVPIVGDHNEPHAYVQENPGFVVAFQIAHATDLIDSNPIGFELPTT